MSDREIRRFSCERVLSNLWGIGFFVGTSEPELAFIVQIGPWTITMGAHYAYKPKPAPPPLTASARTGWLDADADTRHMVVCKTCGFKRCPGVNGHPCTGSNEPGQPGSNFPPLHRIRTEAATPNPLGESNG